MDLFCKAKIILLGICFVPFRKFFKIKKNLWLFGADKGYRYSQNSKYLFEYVLKNHPEINAFWMTQSKLIYEDLRKAGIPVIYNVSIKGIIYSLTAHVKIISTWFDDILYTFPDERQKVAYLLHGIAAKKVYYDYVPQKPVKKTLVAKIRKEFYKHVRFDYKLDYSIFTPVTSAFFKNLMVKAMRNDNIYVVGQPRADGLYHMDKNAIKEKYHIPSDKLIISYMPTHRSYGKGTPPPHLFADNHDAINYFLKNDICMIWKQHINMLKKYKAIDAEKCFIEKSFDYQIDPQELLAITDILITDFSSCFIDFMLLKRPILFYHYDNYEKEDNDLYFGSDNLSEIGKISKDETELLNDIKTIINGASLTSYNEKWNMFNEFYDDKSCERSFAILYNKIQNLSID